MAAFCKLDGGWRKAGLIVSGGENCKFADDEDEDEDEDDGAHKATNPPNGVAPTPKNGFFEG